MLDTPAAIEQPWTAWPPALKIERVRDAVQVRGLSYSLAAIELGAPSRLAIAGVIERTKNSTDPIVSPNHIGRAKGEAGGQAFARKVKAQAARAKKPVPNPKPRRVKVKTRKTGFNVMPDYLADAPPGPEVRTDVWNALPGTAPVALEQHRDGCRWPIGDDLPYTFCNARCREGSSYCPEHHDISYRPYKRGPSAVGKAGQTKIYTVAMTASVDPDFG